MIMDSTLEFCDNVDVSAANNDVSLVGDVIQLPTTTKDLGEGGRPLYLVIAVQTAFASAGAATVRFELASDAQAAIATNNTASTHFLSGFFSMADLTAGAKFAVPLPSGIPESEEYLGLLVRTGTAATTAGSINAFLTMDPQTWKPFPDAVN